MKNGRALRHALRYLAGRDGAHTQTSMGERQALSRYAAEKRRAVEIGVFEGVNTTLIAAALADDGVLYAIDPFFRGRLGICYSEIIARTEVRRRRVRDRVSFVRALSWDAATRIDGEFDFVFIDGDHSLEGIRRDWADWSERITPGGIVALHDTCRGNSGRRSRLGSYDFFESTIQHDGRFEVIEQVDSLSVLQRL